jgi:hypothetical protein
LGKLKQKKGLSNEDMGFSLTERWVPNDSREERVARYVLTSDFTAFKFTDPENKSKNLIFLSMSDDEADIFHSLPKKGSRRQLVRLAADFPRRN